MKKQPAQNKLRWDMMLIERSQADHSVRTQCSIEAPHLGVREKEESRICGGCERAGWNSGWQMRCVPTQVGWKGFAVQPFWAAKHTQGNVRVRSFRAMNLAPSVASMSGQDWHTSRSFINPTESLDWGFVMLKHHRWWVQDHQSHAKSRFLQLCDVLVIVTQHIDTVNVSAPGFYYIFHVPGCSYRCADAWPSLQASSVLIWSLFGLFTTALWIKLLSTFTGSTQHSITTGPLMLPNQAFPNWFSQNLLIYRDEFRKFLSLLLSLQDDFQ